MPKVSLSRNEILDESTKNITGAIATVNGINAFVKAMGFAKSSYYNRLNHPENYTLYELRRLYIAGKLTDDEFLLMIRTDGEKNEDSTLKWK